MGTEMVGVQPAATRDRKSMGTKIFGKRILLFDYIALRVLRVTHPDLTFKMGGNKKTPRGRQWRVRLMGITLEAPSSTHEEMEDLNSRLVASATESTYP